MFKKENAWMKKITAVLLAASVIITGLAMPKQAAAASTDAKLAKQAKKIVNKQVKTSDSEKEKLKKLFNYTEKNYGYKTVKGFQAKKGWEKEYALEMYKNKKGSCYHFAAAYAFLAKQATGYPTRIVIGKTNGFNKKILQDHAWTEVKIKGTWYICDPNLDKFGAKSSGKYFLKKRNNRKMKSTYNKYKTAEYFTL